jgi:hypothetical protein
VSDPNKGDESAGVFSWLAFRAKEYFRRGEMEKNFYTKRVIK